MGFHWMATIPPRELQDALDVLVSAGRDATGVKHAIPAGAGSNWLARFEALVADGRFWP